MKILFLSNFFDHHVKPISESLFRHQNVEYYFVATKKMTEERIKLGYDINDKPDYVIEVDMADRIEVDMMKLKVQQADIVIYGAAPFNLIQNRLNDGKLTYMYCERLFKKGISVSSYLRLLLGNLRTLMFHKNFYLLSASAYAPRDFAITGCFINKAFKWGYFPPVRHYEKIGNIIENKNKKSILWVGRYIDWKHPEIPINIAKRLKEEGVPFHLDMIGTGVLMDELRNDIISYKLEDVITLHGSMTPNEVRDYMESCEILLFTSDKNEGWGAVLNEAMNSGCAVIANRSIGAVPYILEHYSNGLIYDNLEQIYNFTVMLLQDSSLRKTISQNAYRTIVNEWNADKAVENLMILSDNILSGDRSKFIPNGPCSKALRLKDN